jgi:sugar transferase (PEP-CTERM/EpsH1 system associated)
MHILWIKTELLHPVDKGGRIRTYQMLRELCREHRVTYLALDDGAGGAEALARASGYCHEVVTVPFRSRGKRTAGFYWELLCNVASPLPYAVAKYRSAELTRALERLVASHEVDVIVCDFLFPSLNVPNGLGVPVVLFQHNVEAAIWERHAQVAAHPVTRWYMREQWRRMRAFEGSECRRMDRVVAVSGEDCRTLAAAYALARVDEVPTGVDTEYFRPTGTLARNQNEIVFTGSMDWLPNEDAVAWFAGRILPRILAEVPDARFTIVGRTPSEKVRALARTNAAITVTGSVPDVRPYMERAAAFVIPIRIAGGTRLKVYEAMGMEIPIVSTTIGVEGLPVRDGAELLIADEPDRFANAVMRLLRDPELGARLARPAAERVRSEFGWREVAARFGRICGELAGSASVGAAV